MGAEDVLSTVVVCRTVVGSQVVDTIVVKTDEDSTTVVVRSTVVGSKVVSIPAESEKNPDTTVSLNKVYYFVRIDHEAS